MYSEKDQIPIKITITEYFGALESFEKNKTPGNDGLPIEKTCLACMLCFPISDHVMPSWEFAFCFFISYAYICTCIDDI